MSMAYPETWPGTNIIKSRSNAFNWQGRASIVAADPRNCAKVVANRKHGGNGTLPSLAKGADFRVQQRHGVAYSKAAAAK